MHHLFVTPVIAGAVTAGVIALSPGFSDPFETPLSSEEPLVEQVTFDVVAAIQTPLEPETSPFTNFGKSFAEDAAMFQTASLSMPTADKMADLPYQRPGTVVAKAPIAEGDAVPVRADAPRLSVAIKRLNMRVGPGTTFKKIGVLGRGTELEQTGKSNGKWLEVAVVDTGKTGWLHSDYLTKVE